MNDLYHFCFYGKCQNITKRHYCLYHEYKHDAKNECLEENSNRYPIKRVAGEWFGPASQVHESKLPKEI